MILHPGWSLYVHTCIHVLLLPAKTAACTVYCRRPTPYLCASGDAAPPPGAHAYICIYINGNSLIYDTRHAPLPPPPPPPPVRLVRPAPATRLGEIHRSRKKNIRVRSGGFRKGCDSQCIHERVVCSKDLRHDGTLIKHLHNGRKN